MTESEQRHFEVLLEQVLHEVRTVAEGHSALDEKMDRFHTEAKEDHRLAMQLIKFSHDELKKELQSVDHRSEERDARLAAEIQGVRQELKGEIQGVREELKGEIQGVRQELKGEIQGVRQELKEEMVAGFKALGEKVDGHEERIVVLERKAA